MSTRSKIAIPKKEIQGFCKKHHIISFSLFGSVLRDDFGPASDVDVLVEFEKGYTPGYFRLFDMQDELSLILGRKVDLRTPHDLSRYFRDEVLAEREVYYQTQ
jgi:predicted nucleotidyltransferase